MSSVTLKHDGLSGGIVSRAGLQRLLARIGRDCLGLSSRELWYLERSIDSCHEADFRPGAICAHWKSVSSWARELGCSVRQINNIERSLEHKGLIARTFGLDGHRSGVRGDAGIVWAAGINLAPMLCARKLAELVGLRNRQAEEEQALAILRKEIQLVRRSIQASHDDVAIAEAETILPRGRTSRVTSAPALREVLAALMAVHRAVADACGVRETSDEAVEISDASEIFDTPYIQKQISKNLCTRSDRVKPPVTVTARQALLLASAAFAQRIAMLGGPSMQNLVEAARLACNELAIDERGWGSLCQRMGREAAALTILVIDRNARQPEGSVYRVRTPASCAAGIAKQWERDGVNLLGLLMAGRGMERDRDLPMLRSRFSHGIPPNRIGELARNLLKQVSNEARS